MGGDGVGRRETTLNPGADLLNEEVVRNSEQTVAIEGNGNFGTPRVVEGDPGDSSGCGIAKEVSVAESHRAVLGSGDDLIPNM